MLTAVPLFGHMKMLHTVVGMGSAALVVAVPYPAKVTHIFPIMDKAAFFFFSFKDTESGRNR